MSRQFDDRESKLSLSLQLRSGGPDLTQSSDNSRTSQEFHPDQNPSTSGSGMAEGAAGRSTMLSLSPDMINALQHSAALTQPELEKLRRKNPELTSVIHQLSNEGRTLSIPSLLFFQCALVDVINISGFASTLLKINRGDLARILRSHTTNQAPVDDSTTNGSCCKPCVPRGTRISDLNNHELMTDITLRLNLIRDDGKDFMGLGSRLGVDDVRLKNIKQASGNMAHGLLEHWSIEQDATMGKLNDELIALGRGDITELYDLSD